MHVFRSPRFAGNALLEKILNDPDTGELKLGPGSPPDAVLPVQQALFDLQWTQTLSPPVLDPSVFVIGIYGPLTTRTVLNYKEHYDIHFPPDEPTGFVDGFTGPRTLNKLDHQCVLFDECDAAIVAKAAQVRAATGIEYDLPTFPILGTTAAMRLSSSGGPPGEISRISYKRGVGAFVVSMTFFQAYKQQGEETGPLGSPIADETQDGAGVVQHFENGTLRAENGDIVVEITGPDDDAPIFFDADSF